MCSGLLRRGSLDEEVLREPLECHQGAIRSHEEVWCGCGCGCVDGGGGVRASLAYLTRLSDCRVEMMSSCVMAVRREISEMEVLPGAG